MTLNQGQTTFFPCPPVKGGASLRAEGFEGKNVVRPRY